jgi:hypothetical protein
MSNNKQTMKKIYYAIFSYIGVFTLGLYASSHYHFNIPIESYRWGITSLFTTMFIILTLRDKNNEQQ